MSTLTSWFTTCSPGQSSSLAWPINLFLASFRSVITCPALSTWVLGLLPGSLPRHWLDQFLDPWKALWAELSILLEGHSSLSARYLGLLVTLKNSSLNFTLKLNWYCIFQFTFPIFQPIQIMFNFFIQVSFNLLSLHSPSFHFSIERNSFRLFSCLAACNLFFSFFLTSKFSVKCNYFQLYLIFIISELSFEAHVNVQSSCAT